MTFLRVLLLLPLFSSMFAGNCQNASPPPPPAPDLPETAFQLCRASVRGHIQFGSEEAISKLVEGCVAQTMLPAITDDPSAEICAKGGLLHKAFSNIISSGGVKFNNAKLTSCLAKGADLKKNIKLSELSTKGVDELKKAATGSGECAGIIEPLKNEGDSCQFAFECKGDLACAHPDADPSKLVCRPGKPGGASCAISSECKKGFRCKIDILTGGTCEKQRETAISWFGEEAGNTCQFIQGGINLGCNNPCEKCSRTKPTAPYTYGCVANTPANGGCSDNFGPFCQNGFYCDLGTAPDFKKTCKAVIEPTKTCVEGEQTCAPGNYCAGTTGSQTCTKLPVIGGDCAQSGSCATGRCFTDLNLVDRKCFALAENQRCENDCNLPLLKDEFQVYNPLRCVGESDKEVCQKPIAPNGDCLPIGNPCSEGYFCDASQKCIALKTIGADCEFHPECQSGFCEGATDTDLGKCAMAERRIPALAREVEFIEQFILLGAQ